MNTAIIIIAIAIPLLIIVGGGIFFLNRKKQVTKVGAPDLNTMKSSTPKKPMAAEVPDRSQPINVAAKCLATAQIYINQQRYEDAETELKKGLFVEKNHSELSLKLLNVYMSSNKRDEFDNLFLQIQDNSDPHVTQEALKLMSLMDEITINETTADVQKANTQEKQNTESNTDNSLDFPGFGLTDNENKESDTLDFNNQDNSTQSTNAFENNSFESGLSLGNTGVQDNNDSDPFGDLSLNTSQTHENTGLDFNSSVQNPTSDPFASLTSETHSPTTLPTANVNTSNQNDVFGGLSLGDSLDHTESNNGLSLNSDAPHNDISMNANANNSDPLADLSANSPTDSADAFDFDFNDSSDSQQAPVSIEEDLFDMSTSVTEDVQSVETDFNFEELNQPTLETLEADTFGQENFDISVQKPSIENTQTLTEVDPFSDFNMDMPSAAAGAAVATAAVTQNFVSIGTETPTNSEVQQLNTTAPDMVLDGFEDIDAFDFNTEASSPVTEAITSDVQDSFNEDVFADVTPVEEVTNTRVASGNVLQDQPVTAPVINNVDTSILSQDLSFVSELDSNEITLSLATQYLELGEYESAKRLLKEVATAGNATQIQKAQSLLSQVG